MAALTRSDRAPKSPTDAATRLRSPARLVSGFSIVPRTLKFKVALYLGLGLAVVLAAFTLLMERQQRLELHEAAYTHVLQLSEAILRSTHFMMLENQPTYVHRIIEDVARDPKIDRIRIYDKKGAVIDSTFVPEIGTSVDSTAEGCIACHSTDQPLQSLSDSDRMRVFSMTDGRRYLGTMQVIRNEPSCRNAACHSHAFQPSVLGVVDILYSLDDIEAKVHASALRIAVMALAFVLLATGCVGVLVHRLVYTPLSDLEAGAKRLASGDLEHPIPVRGDDELGQLAGSFNAMTAALRESQAQLRDAARTLEQKVDERTRQLRAAEAEAVQSEKLAAVGLLASGIAHELNNPLTGVLTFSHLIRQKLPDGSTDAEDMDLVIRETKRCASIVRRLLDFARQKAPETKVADLNAVVSDVARFIERSVQLQGTTLTLDLDPGLPRVQADENQVKQVIMNMLVNAQQATGSGGSIVVRTRRCPEPLVPEPGAQPVGMVEIAIVDTGCGIAEADLQRIFDPFYTSKEVGKGTGLGLSVSHGIVKSHGGTIKVESSPGKGSAFHVYLPIDLAPAPVAGAVG
jgi:two-component system NtrC family sensor kinase